MSKDLNNNDIETIKEQLYLKLKNDVIDSVDTLVKNKTKEKNSDGKLYNKQMISNELGITYQSLLNYTTDRMPDLKQLLYIKEYFNVPYSLFFKDENNSSGEINSSLSLGLDKDTLNILEKLKTESKNDTYENNYLNTTKLFLINAIIKDEKLFSRLADYFSISLGRNILDKKNSKIKAYKPFKNDESAYSMTKYAIMTDFINYIDKLVKGDDVPRDIKNNVEKYAYKYSGDMQKVIDDYNNK